LEPPDYYFGGENSPLPQTPIPFSLDLIREYMLKQSTLKIAVCRLGYPASNVPLPPLFSDQTFSSALYAKDRQLDFNLAGVRLTEKCRLCHSSNAAAKSRFGNVEVIATDVGRILAENISRDT
jgi:hypothetical protein